MKIFRKETRQISSSRDLLPAKFSLEIAGGMAVCRGRERRSHGALADCQFEKKFFDGCKNIASGDKEWRHIVLQMKGETESPV